ncbi:MAG: TIM barrel protein, partial [Acidobacteria bacterium]|nr:TIM barrel protein [Acidobacteriota bacterium]
MSSQLRVANAPCSWGALEFGWAGPAPSFVRVLDEMSAAGYSGTELGDWGFLPTEPPALKHELSTRRLDLLGAFVPVALTDASAHAAGEEAALQVARLLSTVSGTAPFVVLSDDTAANQWRTERAGRITPADGLDDNEWNTLATGAGRIAAAVNKATGLRTVFHHHCATFVETAAEIDQLMNRTDPALLGLCLDTGHATFGGGDPGHILDRWLARIWHVHLKDCDPAIRRRAAVEKWDYATSVRHGVFCELGKGEVNFPDIIQRLDEAGYTGWLVVEQDVLPSLGTPAASAA